MPAPAQPLTYRPFGAFRLLLAGLVVAQHVLANLAPDEVARASLPYEVGGVAVLVFFALSGFVIAEAADRVYWDRPLAFMANRLLRIAPHFALAVLLSLAVFAWFDHAGSLRVAREAFPLSPDAFGVRNALANLFGFVPFADRLIHTNVLEIGWAVRIEMVFYVIAAAWLVARGKSAVRWAIVAGSLAAFGLAIAGRAPGTFTYVPFFIFGVALYAALDTRRQIYWLVVGGALAGVAVQFFAQPTIHHGPEFVRAVGAEAGLLAVLISVMAVLSVTRSGTWKRADRRLGDFTYPLYLYHQAVIVAVLSLTGGSSWAALLIAVLASLVLSVAMEALVARVIDRWRDRVRGGDVAKATEERQAQMHPAAG